MKDNRPLAVFDTNVLVSGLLNPHGPPGHIAEWLRHGTIQAGMDDRIAAEYEEVLCRPKFSLARHEILIFLRRIRSFAEQPCVKPQHIVQGLPDPDDAPFAECTLALGCALVTGNRRHFPRAKVGTLRIISPRQFCDAIASD